MPPVVTLRGHPDAAVVAERLAHQGQLRLVLSRDRDARRMDLGETRIREERSPPVRAPDRRHVAAERVGREVKGVGVAARGEDDGIRGVAADLAGDEVAHDDPARPAAGDDQVEHLRAREHPDLPDSNLPGQCSVGAEQELLAGLAAGVEGPGDLGSAEGPVGEIPAVLPAEGHAQGHALVNDRVGDLGQPVDVGFPGAEIAPLDGVVEEAVHAVAVVLVVLGGVDPSLGRDRVRPARAVLEAEAEHLVPELPERGGGRGARQSRPHHDDAVLSLVGRVDELHLEAALLPLLLNRAVGHPGVQIHFSAPGIRTPARPGPRSESRYSRP